ncbi:DHH family phosphoesterase [Patescibacteria group bacterium]|nr:DHH family phosphoesterase [Patescibacteria group bacterium]MBU1472356.1 DHH family phosphoesterase [Patescibacteria group bacterium]MBU2460392.1 DHH family phosphoesterase [Patescibacteria group bacterium]MBU2544227.1 DHH family phosphoesterase [Patescibacteria group bacterium]
MDGIKDIVKLKELVNGAQSLVIATHESPTEDSIGSALAMYLGLASLGKRVSIVCPDQVIVGLSNFIGVDKITRELGNSNFIISLDYVDGSIEKVSYNIEGDKFNLVIENRPGFKPFSEENVSYTHAGATADLIFAVDTIHLGGLKKLYEDNKGLFAGKPVINIDRHANNAQYGQINIVDSSASSTSEIVAQVLSSLGVQLTDDIATNLLNAIFGATDNFRVPNVTAAAFEVAAVCLKVGGKRFGTRPPAVEESPPKENIAPQEDGKDRFSPKGKMPKVQEAPSDWLKPKIFRSSNLS